MTPSLTDDLVALSRLQARYADVVSRRAWPELVELFIRGATANVESIESALRSGDFRVVATQAHELKGAAANVQAAGVLAAADRVEAAALNADVEQLGSLAASLRKLVEAVAKQESNEPPSKRQSG